MKQALHAASRRFLPAAFKRRLVSFGRKLDPDAFQQLAYTDFFAPNMTLGLQHLAIRGLQPRHIVDVGAYHGDWARMVHAIWPQAQITMLEANLDKKPILEPVAQEIGARLDFAVLGPEDGAEVVFHVMESGSSVLPENSPLDRREEVRLTQRLDTLFPDNRPDFIKLDVQGYELEVLKGASDLMAGAQAVLMEVSLIEINKNAPLMTEVVGFMRARGFEVADVLELHRRPLDRATNQVDLIFVPATSPLLSDTRHF